MVLTSNVYKQYIYSEMDVITSLKVESSILLSCSVINSRRIPTIMAHL